MTKGLRYKLLSLLLIHVEFLAKIPRIQAVGGTYLVTNVEVRLR